MDISFGVQVSADLARLPPDFKRRETNKWKKWHSEEQFCCMWSFSEPEEYADTQALLICSKLLHGDNRIKTKSRNDPENCLTVKKREKAFYFIYFY